MPTTLDAPTSAPNPQAAAAVTSHRPRKQIHPLVAGGVIAATLGASLAYPLVVAPRMQEARLSRLSVDELATNLKAHQDDPVHLYYLGSKLNDAANFADAETILRRASALDPARSRIRDEWARAQVGNGNISEAFAQLKAFVGTNPGSADAHYLLGKFYFAQNATDRALVELKEATRLNPNHADAWQYLAQSTEDRGLALEAARASARLRPDDPRRQLLLGKTLAEAGDFGSARAVFEGAAQSAPKLAEVHAALADFLLSGNAVRETDTAQAISHAEQAISLGSQTSATYLMLGRALSQAGRNNDAVAPLEEAARRDPYAPAPALQIRNVLRQLGRSEEADTWQRQYNERQAFAQSVDKVWNRIRVSPNDRAARRTYAKLLARRGDAVACLRQHAFLLRLAQDTPPVLAAAARDLAAGGHPELGLPLVEKALAQAKGSPAVYEALGDVYLGLNRTREAAVAYSRVASYRPQMYDELMGRLQKHLQARKASQDPAEQAFQRARQLRQQQIGPRTVSTEVLELSRKAVELAPQNPEYLRELMQNLVRRRMRDEAISIGEKLVAVAPRDGIGNAVLATLKIERAKPGDLEAAEAHLSIAEADPTLGGITHYGRGLVALERGDGAQAVKELNEAITQDPSVDAYYYKLASAYRLTGDRAKLDEASAIYRRRELQKQQMTLALDRIFKKPDDATLYENAARLYEQYGHQQEAAAIRAEWQRRSQQPARTSQ